MVEALVDSWDEIVLNTIPMKTLGPVGDTNLSVFGGKVVTGDYTRDSNPTLSAWVISDLSGGLGVEDMNEGVDVNRYKLGTLYPRSPGQITKGYKVNTVTPGAAWTNSGFRFLGDLKVSGSWVAIVSDGTAVRRLNDTSTLVGTLSALPVNNSVSFKGTYSNTHLVVPMGASGYACVRNSAGYAFENVAPDANHPALQACVVWDNKLIGIDTDGQLWWTVNPTSAGVWVSYGATAKLSVEQTAKELVNYFDRQGQPTVFIVTETDVWQFDPNGPEIFTIDVAFPLHPHHGLAACRWSGDLYFSVGIGVHRYTGGSLSAMGLDRDHGLPQEYSGALFGGAYIVDLVGGYNGLYALVNKPTVFGTATIDGVSTSLYSGLYEYTGTGWHLLWAGEQAAAVANSLGISQGGGSYRLYWGQGSAATGNTLNYIDLPLSFSNPRQRARVTGGFAPNGWLETGIFNAAMQGYNKLANCLDVTVSVLAASAVLTVKYKINTAATWSTLGTVTTTGTTSLPFGALTSGIYPGAIFENIQFRFELTDASNDGFVLDSAVLSYVKIVPSAYSWNFDIDLTSGHGGLSPQDIIDALDDILEAGLMVPFVLRGQTYRVFLSQVTGSVNTGADETGFRRISLLQIPLSLGAG